MLGTIRCIHIYIFVYFNHLSFVCCSTNYQRILSAPLLGYISVVKPHGDWCSCWNHIKSVMLLTQEDNLSSQHHSVWVILWFTFCYIVGIIKHLFVIWALLSSSYLKELYAKLSFLERSRKWRPKLSVCVVLQLSVCESLCLFCLRNHTPLLLLSPCQ